MNEIRIQPAAEEDIACIAALVNGFAAENLMLPRTEESILQSLPDWLVAVADCSQLLGCGSLVPLTEQLVEIRSLAVAPQGQGKGIGRQIVQELVQMATARGYAQICALTLQEAFFEKLGFELWIVGASAPSCGRTVSTAPNSTIVMRWRLRAI